jgi:hypothetical protein
MFSDAFGEKYFLCDERHGAGVGASVSGLRAEILPLWKSNKKVLQCQRNSQTVHTKKESGETRRQKIYFVTEARRGIVNV